MPMSIEEFNRYIREQDLKSQKWDTLTREKTSPGLNFPRYPDGSSSIPERVRSGSDGSGRMSSTPSVNSSASTSLSTIVSQLNDGKTIDLSPSEWTRVSERSRGLSASTLIRLAMQVIRMSARRSLPWQLIDLAKAIYDWYYRDRHKEQFKPDPKPGKEGFKWDGDWEMIGACADASVPVRLWPAAAIWPGNLPPQAGLANNCLGWQGGGYPIEQEGDFDLDFNCRMYGDTKLQPPERWRVVITLIRPNGAPDFMQPNLRVEQSPWMTPFDFPEHVPLSRAKRPPDDWPQSRAVGDGDDLNDDMRNEVITWDMAPPVGPPIQTITDTPFPDRLPPPPQVKEKKIALSLAGTARRIVDWTTEARDFVNSLWDAIPTKGPGARTRKYWKPGYKQAWSVPLGEKMVQIYIYWDHLERSGDWKREAGRQYLNKAFANVFADNVKDFVYGRIGRTAGRASARLGRPVGVQTGPVF